MNKSYLNMISEPFPTPHSFPHLNSKEIPNAQCLTLPLTTILPTTKLMRRWEMVQLHYKHNGNPGCEEKNMGICQHN